MDAIFEEHPDLNLNSNQTVTIGEKYANINLVSSESISYDGSDVRCINLAYK
jgi:hypothetical protein